MERLIAVALLRGFEGKEIRMKILLIEDSKFQRIANERALVQAGYGVIHAGDQVAARLADRPAS
jgi:hypothetical protein